jgi:hypothetical protein
LNIVPTDSDDVGVIKHGYYYEVFAPTKVCHESSTSNRTRNFFDSPSVLLESENVILFFEYFQRETIFSLQSNGKR